MSDTFSLEPLLSLFQHANYLKRLPRTGWLLAGVASPESLADHTCAVAIDALFMAETVNANLAEQGLEEPLDVARVVRLALLHDLAESVITDLPKRSTETLCAQVKHRAEASVMEELLTDLPRADAHIDLWSEYTTLSSPEARLVKDVDRLEMVHQALCYAQRGQNNLSEFWDDHTWYYPLSSSLFQSLLAQRTTCPT